MVEGFYEKSAYQYQLQSGIRILLLVSKEIIEDIVQFVFIYPSDEQ